MLLCSVTEKPVKQVTNHSDNRDDPAECPYTNVRDALGYPSELCNRLFSYPRGKELAHSEGTINRQQSVIHSPFIYNVQFFFT